MWFISWVINKNFINFLFYDFLFHHISSSKKQSSHGPYLEQNVFLFFFILTCLILISTSRSFIIDPFSNISGILAHTYCGDIIHCRVLIYYSTYSNGFLRFYNIYSCGPTCHSFVTPPWIIVLNTTSIVLFIIFDCIA